MAFHQLVPICSLQPLIRKRHWQVSLKTKLKFLVLLFRCSQSGVNVVSEAGIVGFKSTNTSFDKTILLDALPLIDLHTSTTYEKIILQIRLPRVLVAGCVGAGLAVAGVVMQSIFRNPMADPGIIGVSSGGTLGGVVAIYFG